MIHSTSHVWILPGRFSVDSRCSDPGGCARDQAHPLHGMGKSQDATTHDGVGKVENPEVTGSWQLAVPLSKRSKRGTFVGNDGKIWKV